MPPLPLSSYRSHVSTPTRRKNRNNSEYSASYGSGQINAYPPSAGATAAGAVMLGLAGELLGKKGVSLKDLQEDREEYAESGAWGWWAAVVG